jgi:predicted ester cyclase
MNSLIRAPDCVIHFPDPRATTREQLKALADQIVAAFPDVRAEIADALSVGDKVIVRNQVQATHNGAFNGVPATGRPVRWSEIHIYRVAGDKIVEQWSEVNLLGLLMQIGALPAPG